MQDHVLRRRTGDPWYTALYREPARMWWAPPIAGGAAFAIVGAALGDDTNALGGALGWLVVALPFSWWRHVRTGS